MAPQRDTPAVGDPVLQEKYGILLTLTAFPPKVGSAPGFAYEASAEMTPEDEAAWDAETERATGVASPLRPMERYVPREAYQKALAANAGKPLSEEQLEALRVTKPRTMRLTGVTADLRWDTSAGAWRPERRVEQVALKQRERRRPTTQEG
jgi:hypothetical protein